MYLLAVPVELMKCIYRSCENITYISVTNCFITRDLKFITREIFFTYTGTVRGSHVCISESKFSIIFFDII